MRQKSLQRVGLVGWDGDDVERITFKKLGAHF
jgi:hypothetical protein